MESDNPRGWDRKKTVSQDPMQRTLPHSIEAEHGIISSMFQGAIAECAETVFPTYFYSPANEILFSELIELWKAQGTVDLTVFTIWLRDRHLLESVGGVGTVSSLYGFVPTGANVAYYIDIVRDKFLLRRMVEISTQAVRRAFEEESEILSLITETRDAIAELETNPTRKKRTTREIVSAVLDNIENPAVFFGIATGIPHLDKAIGGYGQGQNIVIGGKTSCGKSSLVQQIAEDLAATRGISTAIFSFEMNEEETTQRIIQIRAEVSADSIAKGEADAFQVKRFMDAAEEVGKSPLFITSDRLDVAGIRARCVQWRPRVAIVDYLQIIPETQRKGESPTNKLDRMSAEMKQIAMNLNMTTILLSQLNDKDTTYGSSMLTNDSDKFLVVETSGEYDEKKLVEDKIIRIAKQRNGPRGSIYLSFVKAITKFKARK